MTYMSWLVEDDIESVDEVFWVERFSIREYKHSREIIFLDESYRVGSVHVEGCFRECIGLGTVIGDDRDACGREFIFSGFRIEDVVMCFSTSLPASFIISWSGDGFVWYRDCSHEFTIEWIFYTDHPLLSIAVFSACEEVSSGIDEEVIIAEIPEKRGSKRDGVSFSDASEVEILSLAECNGISIDTDRIEIEIRLPIGYGEVIFFEWVWVADGRDIDEWVEVAIRFSIDFFTELHEIDKTIRDGQLLFAIQDTELWQWEKPREFELERIKEIKNSINPTFDIAIIGYDRDLDIRAEGLPCLFPFHSEKDYVLEQVWCIHGGFLV